MAITLYVGDRTDTVAKSRIRTLTQPKNGVKPAEVTPGKQLGTLTVWSWLEANTLHPLPLFQDYCAKQSMHKMESGTPHV